MATIQMPTTPAERRAQMLREAWQPVRQHLATGAHGTFDFLAAHPPLAQGIYYILMGLWPWLSMSSFLWVTGGKTDLWLVQTVAALLFLIGITLCVAAYYRDLSPPVVLLALGSAGLLALLEVVFVAEGRISGVYLLDVVLQAGVIGLWGYAWQHRPVPGHELATHAPPAQIQAPVAQLVTTWPNSPQATIPAPAASQPLSSPLAPPVG